MASSGPRTWFFMGMALIMVASMFIGFAPTFYLRSYFRPTDVSGSPDLPTYLVVHGIVLTAWFLLFFVQTLLIARDAPGIHRRLGVLGALLAVGVVVLGAVATLRAIPRLPDGTPIIIGNMVGLLMFSLFFVCGVYFRRRPATHKRFMLLASGNLIGPAFAPQRGIGRALPLPWGPIVVVAPLVALIMHDFLRYRLEAASLWGSLAMILGYWPLAMRP